MLAICTEVVTSPRIDGTLPPPLSYVQGHSQHSTISPHTIQYLAAHLHISGYLLYLVLSFVKLDSFPYSQKCFL